MIRKIILVLLVILLILGGSLVILRQNRINREETEKQNALQQQMIPLLQEKRKLQDKNAQLQRQLDGKMQETATVQFLFTDLNEQLYLEVFPMMLQYGFKGIMALSGTEVPGGAGKISIRQFEEMVRDGWGYCLKWDGTTKVWDAFTGVQWKMPESELEMPDTVYLAPGQYTRELDMTLTMQGVRMVIHHGEEDQPIDLTGEENSLWRLGSRVWDPETARSDLQECVQKRGNLVFDVSFGPDYSSYGAYGFQDILYAVVSYQKNKIIEVTDFPKLKELFTNDAENYRWVRTDAIKAEMADNQKKMDELDRQIRQISNGGEPVQSGEDSQKLENDLVSLRNEMDRFDREHPYQEIGTATAELLFPKLTQGVYREIFPQLNRAGIRGVLTVSMAELPGTGDSLSWSQVKDMVSNGWELCLGFEGGDLAAVIEQARKVFAEQNLEMPTALYVAPGKLTETVQGTAIVYGMRVIVHHGELDLPIIAYPDNADFWRAGCVHWKPESQGNLRTSLIETGKNVVIVVDVLDQAQPYVSSGLSTLLEDTEDAVKMGRLTFTGFSEALKMQMEAKDARSSANREREEGLADYQARIDALRERMKTTEQ